eukprot:m.196520 g.196520  ORF g.196520 m.196520 type:complete len:730 (-) comp16818_c5_seq5:569-2758(-)
MMEGLDSNPLDPEPLFPDPERQRLLERRFHQNTSNSQGTSQDGFGPPSMTSSGGDKFSSGEIEALSGFQARPSQKPEATFKRESQGYEGMITAVPQLRNDPSPSTTSDSDDTPRHKHPKLSTSDDGHQVSATSKSNSPTSKTRKQRVPSKKKTASVPLPASTPAIPSASSSISNPALIMTTSSSMPGSSVTAVTTGSLGQVGTILAPVAKKESAAQREKALQSYVKSLSLEACQARLITSEHEKEELRSQFSAELDLAKSRMDDLQLKYRNTIVQLIVSQAHQENRRARDQHLLNVQRLGWATAVRSGLTVHEAWCDGSAFKALYARQRDIEDRRRQLEEERKRLQKLRPSKTKKPAGVGTPEEIFSRAHGGRTSREKMLKLTEEEYQEKLEVVSLNLANLKTEEDSLKTQLSALIRERNLHVREMKRIADEDSARFRNLPFQLHHRYVLMSLLGKGGFSEVYKAYDVDNCRLVACKIHQLNPTWSDAKKANYIKHATREYEIHKDLHHPRVVELYDVFEIDANSFCTVLEYCPGQDLDFLLKQEHRLNEREARNKIIQIMSALKYLSGVDPPVIHYDLKPANVLLTEGEVKITDFGLSKQIKDMDEAGNMDLTSQGAGTYWYLPPECFMVGSTPPKISSKVDVWSVGIIFFQCLYGEKPFGNNQSQQSILQNHTILNARDVKFPEKPKVSEEAKSFIRRCLTYNAELRPDVRTLYMDEYLHRKPARMT